MATTALHRCICALVVPFVLVATDRAAAQEVDAPSAEVVVPSGGFATDADARCPSEIWKVLAIGSSTMGAPLGGILAKALKGAGLEWYQLAAASSGLARPDFWDWAAKARTLVAEHDPDVVIVQLGSNDFQPLTVRASPRMWRPVGRPRPEWVEVYQARIDELLGILGGDRPRLIIWIGPYAYWGDNATQQGPIIDRLLTERVATWVARGGFARYVNVWRETWDERHGPVQKRRFADTRAPVDIRSSDNVHLNVPAVRRLLAEPTVAEILACRDPASTSHDR